MSTRAAIATVLLLLLFSRVLLGCSLDYLCNLASFSVVNVFNSVIFSTFSFGTLIEARDRGFWRC